MPERVGRIANPFGSLVMALVIDRSVAAKWPGHVAPDYIPLTDERSRETTALESALGTRYWNLIVR
jgi:hypothetical protein